MTLSRSVQTQKAPAANWVTSHSAVKGSETVGPPHRIAPAGKPADNDRGIFVCCVAPYQARRHRLGWFFARFFHL
jgi:hypothetical protein